MDAAILLAIILLLLGVETNLNVGLQRRLKAFPYAEAMGSWRRAIRQLS
jgi:hypothetical protein